MRQPQRIMILMTLGLLLASYWSSPCQAKVNIVSNLSHKAPHQRPWSELARCRAENKVEIAFNISEAPHLKPWAEKAMHLVAEWYPRIFNVLAGPGMEPAAYLPIQISKDYQGIAEVARHTVEVKHHPTKPSKKNQPAKTEIVTWQIMHVSAPQVERQPIDAYGVLIHELVHMVQDYDTSPDQWLTESIADYIRFGLYEGWMLDEFPVIDEKKGFLKGYKIGAGFILWLESGQAPGIVRRLNYMLRNKTYRDEVFEELTGKNLDQLWAKYVSVRKNRFVAQRAMQQKKNQITASDKTTEELDQAWAEYLSERKRDAAARAAEQKKQQAAQPNNATKKNKAIKQ